MKLPGTSSAEGADSICAKLWAYVARKQQAATTSVVREKRGFQTDRRTTISPSCMLRRRSRRNIRRKLPDAYSPELYFQKRRAFAGQPIHLCLQNDSRRKLYFAELPAVLCKLDNCGHRDFYWEMGSPVRRQLLCLR